MPLNKMVNNNGSVLDFTEIRCIDVCFSNYFVPRTNIWYFNLKFNIENADLFDSKFYLINLVKTDKYCLLVQKTNTTNILKKTAHKNTALLKGSGLSFIKGISFQVSTKCSVINIIRGNKNKDETAILVPFVKDFIIKDKFIRNSVDKLSTLSEDDNSDDQPHYEYPDFICEDKIKFLR